MKKMNQQFANNAFYNAWDAITDPQSKHFHSIKRHHLDTFRAVAFKTHEDEMFGEYSPKQWRDLVYLDRMTFNRHIAALEQAGLIQMEKKGRLLRITVIDKFKTEHENPDNYKELDLKDYLEEKTDPPEYVPNPEWDHRTKRLNVYFRELIRKYPSFRKWKIPDDKDISSSFQRWLIKERNKKKKEEQYFHDAVRAYTEFKKFAEELGEELHAMEVGCEMKRMRVN